MRSINWDQKKLKLDNKYKKYESGKFPFSWILATAYPYTALRVNTKQSSQGKGWIMLPYFSLWEGTYHKRLAREDNTQQVRAIWTAFLDSTQKNKGMCTRLDPKKLKSDKN